MIKMLLIKATIRIFWNRNEKQEQIKQPKQRNSQHRRRVNAFQMNSSPSSLEFDGTEFRVSAGPWSFLYLVCLLRKEPEVTGTYSLHEQGQQCLYGPRPQASQSQCEKQWRAQHRSLEYCLGPAEITRIQLVLQEKKMSMFFILAYPVLQKIQLCRSSSNLINGPKTQSCKPTMMYIIWLNPW